MKIEITNIQKELEEKFPVEKIAIGYVIDNFQLQYIEELMSQTQKTIKEKVFCENYNMFDYKTYINDVKNSEEKYYVARLSEMITEKVLCVFLMNPEYFEEHFGSCNWFKQLYDQYHNEFFGSDETQYRSRIWYRKLNPELGKQLSLFEVNQASN